MTDLSGFRVAVLATDGFEEQELTEPVRALKEAGAAVSVISLKDGEIQGFRHLEKGSKVRVDRVISDVMSTNLMVSCFQAEQSTPTKCDSPTRFKPF